MRFGPNSPQFLYFVHADNLQRWIFPFLFHNSHALMDSLSVSSEHNLLNMILILIVEVHFYQFIRLGPERGLSRSLGEAQAVSLTMSRFGTTLCMLGHGICLALILAGFCIPPLCYGHAVL